MHQNQAESKEKESKQNHQLHSDPTFSPGESSIFANRTTGQAKFAEIKKMADSYSNTKYPTQRMINTGEEQITAEKQNSEFKLEKTEEDDDDESNFSNSRANKLAELVGKVNNYFDMSINDIKKPLINEGDLGNMHKACKDVLDYIGEHGDLEKYRNSSRYRECGPTADILKYLLTTGRNVKSDLTILDDETEYNPMKNLGTGFYRFYSVGENDHGFALISRKDKEDKEKFDIYESNIYGVPGDTDENPTSFLPIKAHKNITNLQSTRTKTDMSEIEAKETIGTIGKDNNISKWNYKYISEKHSIKSQEGHTALTEKPKEAQAIEQGKGCCVVQ